SWLAISASPQGSQSRAPPSRFRSFKVSHARELRPTCCFQSKTVKVVTINEQDSGIDPLNAAAARPRSIFAKIAAGVSVLVALWSPSSRAGYFLLFDRDGGNRLRIEAIVNGNVSQDLIGGRVQSSRDIGQFASGQPYHVEFKVDRATRRISLRVSSQYVPPP